MSSSTNVSNSAGDLNNDFPCMQTNSQRNAPYPLDVHFLLRTQLQKRREYKPIKEDYETSYCHTSVSKKKEEDEDRSCISPCQSTASSLNSDDEDHETEADFENVSKWFPSLTIKYRYVITVRFIDEGIDKTEQLSHKPKETDTTLNDDCFSETTERMHTAECIIGPRNQPKPIQENKKPTRENQLHSPGTDLGLFEMEEGVVSPFLNGISKQGQMSTQEDDILLEAEDEMENPSPRSTSLYHVMRELEKVKKENQQLKRTISELIRQQHSHQVL